MASFSSIVVVNIREDGQPDLLQVIGENDTIADEVLSPEVRTAATKADEAITKANEVSGKNDEVSSYISTNETNWEAGLDATTRADIVSLSTTVLDSSTGWEEGLDTQTYNDIVTTSNALVGWQNASGNLSLLDQVTRTEIASNAVSSDELATDAVTTDKIKNLAVDTDQLAANSITNAKVKTTAGITVDKLENINDGIILANFTGGNNNIQKVTIADARTNLSSTPAQIKTAYETISESYNNTKDSKLTNIEAGATNNQGALADLNTITNTEVNANAGITVDKLEEINDGIILGNFTGGTDRVQKVTTADARASLSATGAQIKLSYEQEPNAFTDSSATKLNGIEAGATADQTDSEIETAYNNQVDQVGEDEKTDGTETGVRRFSPKDIADMAGTHGGGGGGGGIPNPIDEDLDMAGFNIVSANYIKGQDNGALTFSSNDNTLIIAGPYTGGSVPASGDVSIIADNVILDADPWPTGTGLTTPKIKLGKGLLLTHASGVDISGAGGETVDDPPNGAALVYDSAAVLFKWVKIGATNIGDGAIIESNIADGAVGSDKLATDAASDNIAAGALNSIAFNKLPLVNAESFVGNNNSLGGNMKQFTAAQARSLINNGDQEITGNLGINTAATPTVPLQIEDTGTDDVVLLKTTNDTADAGPVITLMRDPGGTAAANNDYIGQFKFKGESDTGVERVYAKITGKIDVATNGNEDGIIEFMNRNNGSEQIAARFKGSSFRTLNGVDVLVDGNLGVGTNNPSERLDVQGNIAVTGTVDGRDIAADGTKLDGIEGAYAVGTTAPTSPAAGDLWYHTTDEELYAYDGTRSKWLSVTTYEAHFARGGTVTTNHYLRGPGGFDYNTASQVGHPMRYDTTIIAAWGSVGSGGSSGWNHRIMKYDDSAGSNGVAASYAPTGTYTRWAKTDFDVDYDTNDLLGLNIFDNGSATSISNHTAVVAYKRRTS